MAKSKRPTKKKPKKLPLPRLQFENSGEPLTTAELRYWASELRLTDEHQKLLKKSNGGRPDKAYFRWKNIDDELTVSHLEYFFGLDNRPFGPAREIDCLGILLRFRDYLPRFAIPVAALFGDDLLITFHAGPRAGQIWYFYSPFFAQVDNPEDGIVHVADSLVEFLHMLTAPEDPYDPITIALDSPTVRGKHLAKILKSLGCEVYKYTGVTSQVALPPSWEWPKYGRCVDEDPDSAALPAFLSAEKNLTYGYAPKCETRPKGHLMLRINVTKSERKACAKELLKALGDQAEVVEA